MSYDDYVTLDAEFQTATRDGVCLVVDGEEAWAPRQALHASSDRDIDEANRGDRLDVQIREWAAKRWQ